MKNKYIFQMNTSQNLLFKQLNKETILHSIKVAEIASVIANKMNIKPDVAYDCGIWHDAGKVKILDIISKSEKLTDGDWIEIKNHPFYSVEVIENLYDGNHKEIVKEVALYHHCRIENGGYPESIRKDTLSDLIQIIAIADCFEAMTAKRIYKEKINPKIAKEKLLNEECGKFSNNIIKTFVECFEEIEEIVISDIVHKKI